MKTNKNEIKTIKEWADEAGIKLHNYDGYTEIYLTLSGKEKEDFYDHQRIRSKDAGNLLCTRRGFEFGLSNCTMDMPQISEFEKIADILPNFAESQINISISVIYGQLKHISNLHQREDLEKLLELMKLKNTIREKSIKLNYATEKVPISKFTDKYLSGKEHRLITRFNILNGFNGTLEDLEVHLTNKIIKKLEKILQKPNAKLSNLTLSEINVLTSILYNTARWKLEKNIEEEFMYVNILDKPEPFKQSYSIIDENGIKKGNVFSYRAGNISIKGTISDPQDLEDEPEKSRRSKR